MIVTFGFAIYFTKVVVPASGSGRTANDGDLYWGLAGGISQVLVIATAPLLGAICDFSGQKKRALLITFLTCILGTAALWLVTPGALALAVALFIVSNMGFSSGENLIAAFLPELAGPSSMGRLSGYGWALGYLGGLASLGVCFPFLMGGIDVEHAGMVRLSFVAVALFFLLTGLPTFLFLRERALPRPRPGGAGYFRAGLRQVTSTIREARRYRQLFRFLWVFLCYSCGITIVISFSMIFAERELRLSVGEILGLFAILQVSAALGAFVFGHIQDRLGARRTIRIALGLWILAVVGAALTHSKAPFYVVANIAGLAMGSSQSAARALVGSFSPAGQSGEFFGLWALFGKMSAVIGPPVFGLASKALGGQRPALALTAAFFVAGWVALAWIDEAEGRAAAQGDLRSPPDARSGGTPPAPPGSRAPRGS